MGDDSLIEFPEEEESEPEHKKTWKEAVEAEPTWLFSLMATLIMALAGLTLIGILTGILTKLVIWLWSLLGLV